MNATIALAQPAVYPLSTRLRSLELPGPAGRLEAILNEGDPNAPFAGLVCHPHPLGGGNLHNKAVYHTMKVLNESRWGFGFPVLRFNFRGTGTSQGFHDGQAEADDVHAAIEWLNREFNLPIVLAGFSFGAAMAVAACSSDHSAARIRALIALGLPVQNDQPLTTISVWLNSAFQNCSSAATVIGSRRRSDSSKSSPLRATAKNLSSYNIQIISSRAAWLRCNNNSLPG
jgi:alpha/beta superfamily hydrolase